MIDIRYASIRSMDISNGEGIGVALFVQGCQFHCHNCFNPETWDFNGGKEWIQEVEDKFIELASRPYIQRISILGGEPLADENLDDVLRLINKMRIQLPKKTIWLYSGYTWLECQPKTRREWFVKENFPDDKKLLEQSIIQDKRAEIIENVDVVVDGRYIHSQRDITMKWVGSRNQRVINVQQSLQKGEIVLWES